MPLITPIKIAEIAAFEANDHNASANREIHHTVTVSVQRLQDRYDPQADLHTRLSPELQELNYYLALFKDPLITSNSTLQQKKTATDKKNKAYRCFYRHHTNVTWENEASQLTLPYLMALIWIAANDSSDASLPQEMTDKGIANSASFIAARKSAILEQLYESEIGNISSASCLPGMYNRLVRSLNYAHADVIVLETKAAIKSLAFENISAFVKSELSKESLWQQKVIFNTWDEDSSVKKTFADAYQSYIQHLYADSLSAEDHTEISNSFVDLSKPVIHPAIQLEIDIHQLPIYKNGTPRDNATRILKAVADSIYSDDSWRDFHQMHIKLSKACKPLIAINKAELQQLALDIRRTFNNDTNMARAQAIARLKAQFSLALAVPDLAAINHYSRVNSAFLALKATDQLVRTIINIEVNEYYPALLEALQQQVSRVYDKREGEGFSEALQRLRIAYRPYQLLTAIAALPNDTQNQTRQAAMDYLKVTARRIHFSNSNNIVKYDALYEAYQAFQAVERYAQNLHRVSVTSIPNSCAKKALTSIASLDNPAYCCDINDNGTNEISTDTVYCLA